MSAIVSAYSVMLMMQDSCTIQDAINPIKRQTWDKIYAQVLDLGTLSVNSIAERQFMFKEGI